MSKFIPITAKNRLKKTPRKVWKQQGIFFTFVEKTLPIFTSWILSEVHNHKHDILFSPHILT